MSNSDDMNDKQLLESCIQGDVEEFRKIVEKYRGKIMAMAQNILGNREDAEDACQDTFIRAYSNLEKYDFQKAFSNWLFSILYNRCLDHLRKRKRFIKYFVKMKSDFTTNFDIQSPNPTTPLKLRQNILRDLSPKEKTSLFLWAIEGYTSEEIASVLKCSSSTARVHLFKARKKIKKVLEQGNDAMQNC